MTYLPSLTKFYPKHTSYQFDKTKSMIPEDEVSNFEDFRDCVSELLISRLSNTTATKKKKATKGRKNEIKPVIGPEQNESNDASELGETIDYLATEIFTSLPMDLRTLSYSDVQNDVGLADKYGIPLDTEVYERLLHPLPLSVSDSLISFGTIEDETDLTRLLEPMFTAYISSCLTPPPEFAPQIRATECEICEREHLPLTYHHLIPRAMHTKAVKRGWHKDWELNKVAWLCRACHSFVHRLASNEELAKEWYSVERLLEREDVQKWAVWVGRVRWKTR